MSVGFATTNNNHPEAFQVKNLRARLRNEEKKIGRRLAQAEGGREPRDGGPELAGGDVRYELSARVRAISAGGIGVVHKLAQKVGLVDALDELQILKRHRPYRESDHILNIAYNAMCGGAVLDDIELRRKDAAFLDALGARTIPDPTTAGDFCRRFSSDDIGLLMTLVNEVRLNIWRAQPAEFFEETARIDADGTIVPTTGECKQGMDVSYNGVWGYQPLLISLANTGEPLFIVNRGANRPSQEDAPEYFDRAVDLVRAAGWKSILLRGDTAFSTTSHFDRWDDNGVRFVFGYDAVRPLIQRAEAIDESDYCELVRKAEAAFAAEPRAKQPRVKEQIVCERGFRNLRLEREDIAEFEHQPRRSKRPYRFVVLCKTIVEEQGQITLGQREKYFFYVTNDRSMSADDVVREANRRCNQENLIEQLKNGARALRAPLNTLESNWAYMVIVSLAWSLKAWWALSTPVSARWRERHQADRERVLRMDFRSFVHRLILIPAQILRTGRRLIFRLLGWRPDLPILFRLLDAL